MLAPDLWYTANMHTVTAAAVMLGISPATLRRWSDAAAPVLPDFRPQVTPRQFSSADVTALAELLELARQHPNLSRAQIVDRVRAGDLTAPPITTLQPAPAAAPRRRRPPADAAALEALTAQVAALQDAIEALTAQIVTLTTSPPQLMIEPQKPDPPSFWQRLRAWFSGPQE